MNIAICGRALPPFNKGVLKKSYEIGKYIALNNYTLRFGGCWGYPYEAARGAFEHKGKVISVSPAKDRKEHISKYNFPLDNFTEIDYTGLGKPGRNLPLVLNSNAIIIIGGQIGTLNEFSIAFHEKKPIGVLKGSGGITNIIKKIGRICGRGGEKEIVVYEKETKILVRKLGNLLT